MLMGGDVVLEFFFGRRECKKIISGIVVVFVVAMMVGVFQEFETVAFEVEKFGEAHNLAGEDGAGGNHLLGNHQLVVFK